jgi:hypothetical protein
VQAVENPPLIKRVNRLFHTHISVNRLYLPDELCELVIAEYRRKYIQGAPREAMFIRASEALQKVLGVAPSAINPDTRLDELIPKRNRQQHWRDLALALHVRLPPLQIPDTSHHLIALQFCLYLGVLGLLFLGVLVPVGVMFLSLVCWQSSAPGYVADLLVFLLSTVILSAGTAYALFRLPGVVDRLTYRWRTMLPPGIQRVKDLVLHGVMNDYGALVHSSGAYSPSDIRLILRWLTWRPRPQAAAAKPVKRCLSDDKLKSARTDNRFY